MQINDVLGFGVVVDRGPWNFHDAGLDSIHQREIANCPGEDVALVVARSEKIEGGRREIADLLDSRMLRDRPQTVEPDACLLVGILLSRSRFSPTSIGLVLVAVVGFVVEDDDLLLLLVGDAEVP